MGISRVVAGHDNVGELHKCVDHASVIHRADVRSMPFCGRWWMNTEREIAQIPAKNDYRPQSTRLLPLTTKSNPTRLRNVDQ